MTVWMDRKPKNVRQEERSDLLDAPVSRRTFLKGLGISGVIAGLACERLPAKLRAAFLLRTQEELSFEEIAEVLDVTEETVRWRVFKARHLLMNELKAYLDEKRS